MVNLSFGLIFFFFSSRRRHTRCSRDWSSDVCSSDLGGRRESSRRSRGRGPGGERKRGRVSGGLVRRSLPEGIVGARLSVPHRRKVDSKRGRPNKRLKLPGPAFNGSARLCACQQVTQGGALAPAGARPAA